MLRSSSPTNPAVAPPCKNAEMHKIYIIRILFQRTIQISYQFQLILPILHGSKRNIFEIKTFSSSYSLNTWSFSILNISTYSTKQDLHIYDMKLAKREIEFQLTLNLKLLNSCSQVLYSSRSLPLHLLWSFVHKETDETTWIYLNFQLPSTWECS